jgi:mannitol/fructose-specific phosphotransferase system IIA component (Ntr-type)
MTLGDFITKDAIRLDLEAEDKDGILEELLDMLEKSYSLTNLNLVKNMIKSREELGSTGIGKGVAIPHGRSLVANKIMAGFARSKNPIDYNSIDDKPVNMFFVVIAPPLESSNHYLPLLGTIAKLVARVENRNKLEAFQTPEEVWEYFNGLQV